MTKTQQFRRRRLYVDPEVQSGMLFRLVAYWLCSSLFITLPLAFVNTIYDADKLWIQHVVDVWANHWPIFAMMTLLVPFAYYDLLKFSNRFVGPIYRLRADLKSFFATGKAKKITFRERDYWKDVAEGVSRLTDRINQLESKLAEKENQSGQTV